MGRVKSAGQAQKFLATHDQITTPVHPKRHCLSTRSLRHGRVEAFSLWPDYAANLAA